MRISDFGPPWRGFVKKVCWHGSISEEGYIEPQQLESGLGQGLRNQFKCYELRVTGSMVFFLIYPQLATVTGFICPCDC